MTPAEWKVIGEGVVAWTGHGRESWSSRRDSFVVEAYGAVEAARLLPIVRELHRDFYATDAAQVASDFAEMESIATADFARKHPECPNDAVRAFVWCFSFDFK